MQDFTPNTKYYFIVNAMDEKEACNKAAGMLANPTDPEKWLLKELYVGMDEICLNVPVGSNTEMWNKSELEV